MPEQQRKTDLTDSDFTRPTGELNPVLFPDDSLPALLEGKEAGDTGWIGAAEEELSGAVKSEDLKAAVKADVYRRAYFDVYLAMRFGPLTIEPDEGGQVRWSEKQAGDFKDLADAKKAKVDAYKAEAREEADSASGKRRSGTVAVPTKVRH